MFMYVCYAAVIVCKAFAPVFLAMTGACFLLRDSLVLPRQDGHKICFFDQKGIDYFTRRGQILYARGSDTLRIGVRCFTATAKKPSIYAGFRARKKSSTISTISTISQPAPTWAGGALWYNPGSESRPRPVGNITGDREPPDTRRRYSERLCKIFFRSKLSHNFNYTAHWITPAL